MLYERATERCLISYALKYVKPYRLIYDIYSGVSERTVFEVSRMLGVGGMLGVEGILGF